MLFQSLFWACASLQEAWNILSRVLVLVRTRHFFSVRARCAKAFIGASQVNSSLLTVSVIAVLLPAAFSLAIPGNSLDEANRILHVSHGVRPFPPTHCADPTNIMFLSRLRSSSYSVSRKPLLWSCTELYLSLRLLPVFPTLLSCEALRWSWGWCRQVSHVLS